MKISRRDWLRFGALGCGLGIDRWAWPAQTDYPSQPVTIVVPNPAGGVVDIIGRLVADRMSAALETSFIIENRVGAGGTIGAKAVASAKPDGYSLLLGGSATNVFAPFLYRNLPYDPLKDFAPIGQISAAPLVLVVNAQTNVRTVPELVALLRAKGVKANYGSNGNGTFPHLAGELFKQANQLQMTHVPYSGGPAVLTALITGDVDMSINHIPVVQGMVKAGKLRVIATTGHDRSKLYPDVPTLQEQGMKAFEANAWFGLFAPSKTPAAVVARLSAALAGALGDESLRQRLVAQGDEPSFSEPAAFAAFVAAEVRKWSAVIKAANVTIN